MKAMISNVMLTALLSTTTINPALANNGTPTMVKSRVSVESVFRDFKRSVFLEGQNAQAAAKLVVSKLIKAGVSSSDLELYVAKNSTKEGYKNFNNLMDSVLEDADSLADLSSEDLSFLMQNALEKTNKTGSNFMSCSAGKSVGVPLLVVGVILGIVAVVNASASKEVVTKDFLERKQAKNKDHLNVIADLETEITTYESDIIYYNDESEELNRRINSGNYSDSEVEEMFQLLRDYEFYISDSYALIGEAQVDVTYFEDLYAADVLTLQAEEASELARVDERKASAKSYGVIAGVVGGVGAIFTVAGLSDCN